MDSKKCIYRYRGTDRLTEDYVCETDAAAYVARYRDRERFLECCRACGNYGKTWACPPLGPETEQWLAGYRRVLLVVTRIVPAVPDLPLDDSVRLIAPERKRLEACLLHLEHRYGGRAFTFTGGCSYCPEGTCTRPLGLPCRHPERVRPSLEAAGFNLSATAEELFGIPMCWGREGRMPAWLTLVGGFFHNSSAVEWDCRGPIFERSPGV